MQTIYPSVIYPDGDSPSESTFSVPEMEIVDYLKIVIPVHRKDGYIYGLFPVSEQHISSAAVIENGGLTYHSNWYSARYNGFPTSQAIGWESNETFLYPDWFGVSPSPFGSAPAATDTTSLSTICTIEYGELFEFSTSGLPGYTFYLGNFSLTPEGGTGDAVSWVIVTRKIIVWAILAQRIDNDDGIVILIPILAALIPILALSLTANVGNFTHTNDNRRRFTR